ncbi:hypothetical protein [Runella sp.]|uniref:hypothetical protein n=1 Tax=Runella sp. TaxID=1960881 RepID=UPI003D0B6E07
MKAFYVFTGLMLGLMTSFANSSDSVLYFPDLAQKIGLKHPKLRNKEYEIRLWIKTALVYGDAQELYVIHQKNNRLTLKRFHLYFQKHEYLRHTASFNDKAKDTLLLRNLIAHKVFTLPNGKGIVDEVLKEERQKMSQFSDTVRVEIVNDTIRVVGRKRIGKLLLVLDGTGYYLEAFGKNFFHKYSYHCPATYSETYPQKKDFGNANAIIKLIFNVFRDYDKRICRRSTPYYHRAARIQWRKNVGKNYQFYC